jgi:hypothetical protein
MTAMISSWRSTGYGAARFLRALFDPPVAPDQLD